MDNNIIEFMKSEDQIEMMLMQMQMGYNDLKDVNPAMIDHFMTSCTNHDNNINLNNNNNSTNVQNNPHLNNTITSNSSPHDDDDELLTNNVVHNIHPSIISFSQHDPQAEYSKRNNSMAAMREMIFRIAAMQPVHIDPESVKPPKRKNVRISSDPQSVAARHRRERISERIRILQRLVPGGTKMDTASMLDEAIHYVKFLKNQVQSLESVSATRPVGVGFPVPMASGSYFPVSASGYRHYSSTSDHNVQHLADA